MQYELDLNTVICMTCGFVFTNPVPEKSVYESFYIDAYADYYGHIASRSSGNYRDRIPQSMKQRLNWISDVRQLVGKRLLEIGPGKGQFLWCAQQSGAEVVGLEPSRVFFEILQKDNLPSVFGSLDQFTSAKLGYFDFIAMLHVLEHFYDPNVALEQTWELLNDNGLLVLEVPNILKPFRSLNHYFLRYVHPSSFSKHTLDAFLHKHSFEPVFFNEGGMDWRTPQSLFVIAQKKDTNKHTSISPENWEDVVLHLKKYRRAWKWWKKFRWMIYQRYISIRHIFFRLGRSIKNSYLGDRL